MRIRTISYTLLTSLLIITGLLLCFKQASAEQSRITDKSVFYATNNLSVITTTLEKLTADDYFGLADKYLREGEFEKALVMNEHVLQLDPAYIWAYSQRGYLYQVRGDHENAVVAYTTFLEMSENPDPCVCIWRYRGYSYEMLGQYEKSHADFTKAIDTVSNVDADLYFHRGIASLNLNRYPDAILDFETAIQLNPDLFQAYFELMELYQGLGDDEKAEGYARAVTEIAPTEEKPIWGRGYFNLTDGNFEKAIYDFTYADKFEPKRYETHINRGYAYFRLGRFDMAAYDFWVSLNVYIDTLSGK